MYGKGTRGREEGVSFVCALSGGGGGAGDGSRIFLDERADRLLFELLAVFREVTPVRGLRGECQFCALI